MRIPKEFPTSETARTDKMSFFTVCTHTQSAIWSKFIKQSWKEKKIFDLDSNGPACSEAVLNLVLVNGFQVRSEQYAQTKINLFVSQLDASKLEFNWRFLVEFFATFAPVGIPSLAKFKAWFLEHKDSIHHPVRLAFFACPVPSLKGRLLHLCTTVWIFPSENCEEVDQSFLADEFVITTALLCFVLFFCYA